MNLHLINTVGVLDRVGCVECRCPGVEPGDEPRGGVICCRDCPSASAAAAVDYALEYTSIFRRARQRPCSGHV